MPARLQLKLGAVTDQDRLPDSPDTIVVVEPSVGSVGRTKGNLYLLVTSTVPGNRAREATRMVADTIRNEYYYDESAGIRQCLTKVLGVANKRLAHQRDKYGLAQAPDGAGPVGVAVAVVRGRELYVATVGPAEAYLIRQARLSTLPDPNRERGLPAEGLEPEVWRGELQVGDSLSLVSANVMGRIGSDALKDALVTLHPQSAIEHLHARFVAADGKGSDGAFAFEASEVGATYKARSLVPVRPAEPLAGAPDKGPIPLADSAVGAAAAVGVGAARARDAAGSGFGRFVWRIQDLLPRRKPGPRKVTAATSRMETQRRAAVALLAFIAVAGGLVLGVYAVAGQQSPTEPLRSLSVAQRAFQEAEEAAASVSGPGVDLIADDPSKAMELLTAAYAKLDEAQAAGYPATEVSALRAEVSAGLDRLYGVVPVRSSTAFTFPSDTPVLLEELVRGNDGAPYVLDSAGKTVWRIDLAKKTASPVAVSGQKATGGKVADPKVMTTGGPDVVFLDTQEQPLALAATAQQGQGDARQDQRRGFGHVGRRHRGDVDLRGQLRCRALQALRGGPVRAEHHGRLAIERRVGIPGEADAPPADRPPGGRHHRPAPRRGHLRGRERRGRPRDPGVGLERLGARGHADPAQPGLRASCRHRTCPTARRASAPGRCTPSTAPTTGSSPSTRPMGSTSRNTSWPMATRAGATCGTWSCCPEPTRRHRPPPGGSPAPGSTAPC